MRSLRARLVLGLVILAAVGLVLVGGITYAEQRSFLLDRVDQQAQSAVGPISHALDSQVYGPGPGGLHGRGGGDDGPGFTTNLPPGTYGQKRGPDGRVLARVVLSYGEQPPPAPKLPAELSPGKTITVGATGGSGLHYRVLAQTDPDNGGLTVVAVPLTEADQTLSRLLTVEVLVIAGVLLALGLLAWLVVRVGLRPLDRMARTADAIAAGDLSRRVAPASERTEVGRLGLALNTMLDRLEQAFAAREASEERLRRFLADASHELRTPLASIRGYSELFRMGAAEDPADTRKAMRRIEDEAARMGVLVEDLLTLARLDAVREPVREPVALAEVAQEAVGDARVVAPERSIELAAEPAAVVLGDRLALRQVLDNLLRNAVAHTPPGTPIDVTVRRDGGSAVLAVRDHGTGLPPGDPEALFERFWRAEGGRERGKGGAGLGLAIVGAIVDGHDGTVTAANAPGGGARFTVRVPAAPPAEEPGTAAVSQPALSKR